MTLFAYQTRDAQGRAAHGEMDAADSSAVAQQLRAQGLTPLRIWSPRPGPRAVPSPAPPRAPPRAPPPAPPPAPRVSPVPEAASASSSLSSATNPVPAPTGLAGAWQRLRQQWQQLQGRKLHAIKVSDTELQLLTRELHALVKAGVPLTRSLDILTSSTVNPDLAAALTRVGQTLGKGQDFSTALEQEAARTGLFSPFYVSIIRIGEGTGRLQECLLRLSQHLQFLRTTREQLQAAIRYPAFVILAAVAAVVLINIFVIPQFERVFRGLNAELPLLTRLLLGTSRFFTGYWPLLLLAAAGAYVAVQRWLASPRGAIAWSHWQLKLPIAGELIDRACLARFCTSFAVSLRSGVPLTQALGIVADNVGNHRFAMAIRDMRGHVEHGDSVRVAASRVGVFPNSLLQVIAVGEETGALSELLEEIGSHYQSEVEYQLSRLTARLEPILIAVLGVVVLVLALGVFLPMWELGRASTR